MIKRSPHLPLLLLLCLHIALSATCIIEKPKNVKFTSCNTMYKRSTHFPIEC